MHSAFVLASIFPYKDYRLKILLHNCIWFKLWLEVTIVSPSSSLSTIDRIICRLQIFNWQPYHCSLYRRSFMFNVYKTSLCRVSHKHAVVQTHRLNVWCVRLNVTCRVISMVRILQRDTRFWYRSTRYTRSFIFKRIYWKTPARHIACFHMRSIVKIGTRLSNRAPT